MRRAGVLQRRAIKKEYYEIDKKYYYKYNEVLGVNTQAVIQKNDEA
ncbi:MAG: hypothetical protein RQ885_01580 [Desulfurococcales archaeon]|jgi:hypothetical protein|nr:hypothetical protein [Desulfurococcales archaeon]